MVAPVEPVPDRLSAKRRSRFGCRNCKLRRIKCDENKPQCRRCVLFRVRCNFDTRVGDLQPVHAVSDEHIGSQRRSVATPRAPISSCVWASDDYGYSYQLNTRCQHYLTRYFGWSLAAPNNPIVSKLNARLLALSFKHPHLMHACLAVALAFDRNLDLHSSLHRREAMSEECFHRSRSTSLFIQCLQQPVKAGDKDAIWGTAASLALLAFSAPAGTWLASEESWPLSARSSPSTAAHPSWPPSPSAAGSSSPSSDSERNHEVRNPDQPSELQWLLVKEGKMSLWPIANPIRPESIFSIMNPVYEVMFEPLPTSGAEGIHPALAAVCGLDPGNSGGEGTSMTTQPFFHPCHAVCRLLTFPDVDVTIGHTEVFMNTIRGDFRSLLLAKDTRALLLLYLWYRKARRSLWFVNVRAKVEEPAICTYIRRFHAGSDVVEFLPGGKYADEECLVLAAVAGRRGSERVRGRR
ncbi:uncharacterized protein B0I36DRAFT_434047 [Microdochium trichocladiopsis]|uniref:Zn(2)-C6 fungal-type domain-containing protein n=1 Tax=Microdochium trichocladiopsis TaxID=1682393 RepID=A0A9P8Y0S3_9PEZI|nr:uncharacterized protein B0I36DRAFT_434047 [Microdochium trichocladiopsis]KAH7026657.1 hypothetical protein B0I36DRAFT_434047 [Microdochium trichocladiopsis]